MNRDAQVKCLQASSCHIPILKTGSHIVEDAVIATDRLTDDELACVIQRLPNLVAARYFADSGIAGIVSKDDDVAGKEGAVRTTKIHQHAVVAGNGNYLQFGDHRGAVPGGR